MAINRKKFLGLALTMWLTPVAGCGGGAKKSEPSMPTSRTVEGAPVGPAAEGGMADEGSNLAPGDEGWVAPGDEGAVAPANECSAWDPSGECIGWGATMPADECVDWDPSGECISWQ